MNKPALQAHLLFCHGAGVGHTSDFMTNMAALLRARGIHVEPFTFSYMQANETSGKRRPPPKAETLIDELHEKLDQMEANTTSPIFLVGKSMGGRVATMLAAQLGCSTSQTSAPNLAGVIVLGYPFHPNGKPEKLRVDHLDQIQKPVHIFQGTRDAMGNRDEVKSYSLPSKINLCWLDDGNHDLKPRKLSGFTQQDHLESVANKIEDVVSAAI